ncbi:MAG: hypothetical protein IID49_12190 [Proteobacteria bacterium]|nr:hypothetical protein [Pseudomonadota bacterium]
MTMRAMAIIAAACALTLAPLAEAPAAGNLTRRAERLEPLELNAGSGFSIKSYDLETGVYYRWRIVGDGREEYRLVAPELFRNSWIDRVSIEGHEVVPAGLHAVAFDGEGEIDIWFVPIRPGDYRFYIETLERQGFSGVMHVR